MCRCYRSDVVVESRFGVVVESNLALRLLPPGPLFPTPRIERVTAKFHVAQQHEPMECDPDLSPGNSQQDLTFTPRLGELEGMNLNNIHAQSIVFYDMYANDTVHSN